MNIATVGDDWTSHDCTHTHTRLYPILWLMSIFFVYRWRDAPSAWLWMSYNNFSGSSCTPLAGHNDYIQYTLNSASLKNYERATNIILAKLWRDRYAHASTRHCRSSKVIAEKLANNQSLENRCLNFSPLLEELMELCLWSSYFQFQDFYKQTDMVRLWDPLSHPLPQTFWGMSHPIHTRLAETT